MQRWVFVSVGFGGKESGAKDRLDLRGSLPRPANTTPLESRPRGLADMHLESSHSRHQQQRDSLETSRGVPRQRGPCVENERTRKRAENVDKGGNEKDEEAYTVGMYSPGNAFVV